MTQAKSPPQRPAQAAAEEYFDAVEDSLLGTLRRFLTGQKREEAMTKAAPFDQLRTRLARDA